MTPTTLIDLGFALLLNAVLLLGLAQIVDLTLMRKRDDWLSSPSVVAGLLVGIVGMLLMRVSATLLPGVIFDSRSVLLAISGLFFGPAPTAIAMGMTAAYRWSLGGIAAPTGVAVILASGLLGLLWRRILKRPLEEIGWRSIYALGLAVHVAMLALMLLMPWETARAVLARISLPVLLLYPLMTLALGLFFVDRIRRQREHGMLREREARYHSLFENNHSAMLIIDPGNGAIVDANAAAAAYYGWSRERLRQMKVAEINTLPPQEVRAVLDEVLKAGRGHYEFCHRHADGTARDVEVFVGVIPIEGRAYLHAIVHDIGARKAAEAALRESEDRRQREHREALHAQQEARVATLNLLEDALAARREAEMALGALRESETTYASLFGNMLNGLAHCLMSFENGKPKDFLYLDVNKAFETLTGLGNVAGKWVSEAIPGIRDSDPELFEIYARVARGGPPERFESYVAALDMWFSIAVYSPKPDHFVAIFDVITERKRAEAALRESENRFREIYDNVSDAIFIHDIETGRILDVNRRATEMYDYAREEMLALEVETLSAGVPPYTAKEAGAWIARTRSEGPQRFEWQARDRDGHVFWVEVNLRLATIGGQPRVIAMSRDITARKHDEEVLRRQTEELAARNAELERFNRAMIGREIDMIALKRQINALAHELGRAPPFDLSATDGQDGGAP